MGTDAAGYVKAIADGEFDRAYSIARAHNPFPSVCGRVCAAPCESACRRSVLDAPVSIRALKRSACEQYGVEHDPSAALWHGAHGPVPPATKPSVGIIGAGPAGLTAAHDLRLAGHAVTIYESADRAGGMMALGIPEFRLPRAVLDAEIAAILSLGVELQIGCRVGTDVTIDQLLERHAALFIGTGCGAGKQLSIPGRELDGVWTAVDFLINVNRGFHATVGAHVVVLGGGSVAFDAARTALREADVTRSMQPSLDAARSARRGGAEVTIVAVESREQLSVDAAELDAASAEGITLLFGHTARAILGGGKVRAVELAPVRAAQTESGLQITAAEGDIDTRAADTVIFAVGQRAESQFVPEALAVARTSWGGLAIDASGRTSHERLWAGGDLAHGPRDLIDAVADGQRAAASMIAALDPTLPLPQHSLPTPAHFHVQTGLRRFWSGYDRTPRAAVPSAKVEQRTTGFTEVELGYSAEQARQQASRCLLCDDHILLDAARCILCGLCVDVCPMGCIAIDRADAVEFGQSDQSELTLNDDRCIRCGLCVARCPSAALTRATLETIR